MTLHPPDCCFKNTIVLPRLIGNRSGRVAFCRGQACIVELNLHGDFLLNCRGCFQFLKISS